MDFTEAGVKFFFSVVGMAADHVYQLHLGAVNNSASSTSTVFTADASTYPGCLASVQEVAVQLYKDLYHLGLVIHTPVLGTKMERKKKNWYSVHARKIVLYSLALQR